MLSAHSSLTVAQVPRRGIPSYSEHNRQLPKSIRKAKVRSRAQAIKRLGDKESRTVEHELHRMANELVARGRERNAVIMFGHMTCASTIIIGGT